MAVENRNWLEIRILFFRKARLAVLWTDAFGMAARNMVTSRRATVIIGFPN
jgi:hypothetical protein